VATKTAGRLKRIGERAAKDPRRLDWSRKLPKPFEIPGVMKLRALADVRTLLKHPPDGHRSKSTWQVVTDQLRAAAAGGDIAQLAVTLRLVLFLEKVESR